MTPFMFFNFFCSGGGANLTNLTISCEAHPNSTVKQQVQTGFQPWLCFRLHTFVVLHVIVVSKIACQLIKDTGRQFDHVFSMHISQLSEGDVRIDHHLSVCVALSVISYLAPLVPITSLCTSLEVRVSTSCGTMTVRVEARTISADLTTGSTVGVVFQKRQKPALYRV